MLPESRCPLRPRPLQSPRRATSGRRPGLYGTELWADGRVEQTIRLDLIRAWPATAIDQVPES